MRCLILGALGQDGYYLTEHLLRMGHAVTGFVRRSTTAQERVAALQRQMGGLEIEYGDVTDSGSVASVVQRLQPERVFNLAAISYVPASWENPAQVIESNAKGVINVLEAVRSFAPDAHVAQASTSEMFGNERGYDFRRREYIGLNERSPMHPASIYGASKLLGHNACEIYRQSYGLYVSSVIMFNHESPRRPEHFVTRKVTRWAALTAAGKTTEPLRLGNLQASRDWGYAGDYMVGMAKALDATKAQDYVLATGVQHSIADLITVATETAGITDFKVESTPANLRPHDLQSLLGDASTAREQLGWAPTVTFEELIANMTRYDMESLRRD